MPIFARNTLSQAAVYISKELGEPYQVDDVESLIEEGELIACVLVGEQPKYLFPDFYIDLKNGLVTLVANSRKDLSNGMDTILEQYGPVEFRPYNVVILKEDIEAFLLKQADGKPAISNKARQPQAQQRFPAQETAIEAILQALGYDPLNIPPHKPGDKGIKSEVRHHLDSSELFTAASFDHAWKRVKKREREMKNK
jgi:hypothetical protein